MGTLPTIILALSVFILSAAFSVAILYKITEGRRKQKHEDQRWEELMGFMEPFLPQIIETLTGLLDPPRRGRSAKPKPPHQHH